MEQEKNKVPSQENENPGLEKFQRAQELYERYFISNEEADFEEMITVLDSIYKNRVKSELREKGCCDKENYEDAMQEARQGIWTRIKKQRETGELHKEFSQYCGGIYTYKAVDIAKKKYYIYAFPLDSACCKSCKIAEWICILFFRIYLEDMPSRCPYNFCEYLSLNTFFPFDLKTRCI